MSKPRELDVSARRDLDLVRALCVAGLCTLDRIGAHYGVARSTVSNWLAGRRRSGRPLFAEVFAEVLTSREQAAWHRAQLEALQVGTVISLAQHRALRQLAHAAADLQVAFPELAAQIDQEAA